MLLACDTPEPATKATPLAPVETPAPEPAPADEPPWSWSWESIESTATLVRAGRDLTPSRWPNDAKVAVALSFDLDNESSALRDAELRRALVRSGEHVERQLAQSLALLAAAFEQLGDAEQAVAALDEALRELGSHATTNDPLMRELTEALVNCCKKNGLAFPELNHAE
jgi:hypothetical protein